MQLLNWDLLEEGNQQWRDQIMGAIYCGGSKDLRPGGADLPSSRPARGETR